MFERMPQTSLVYIASNYGEHDLMRSTCLANAWSCDSGSAALVGKSTVHCACRCVAHSTLHCKGRIIDQGHISFLVCLSKDVCM